MRQKPLNFSSSGPEEIIVQNLMKFFRSREWHVMRTHGNMFQSGFPDLWITHAKYGARWVEVKNPLKFAFTPAQLEQFPKMCAFGSGVWILTAATEEEYRKLFAKPNWYHYLMG